MTLVLLVTFHSISTENRIVLRLEQKADASSLRKRPNQFLFAMEEVAADDFQRLTGGYVVEIAITVPAGS